MSHGKHRKHGKIFVVAQRLIFCHTEITESTEIFFYSENIEKHEKDENIRSHGKHGKHGKFFCLVPQK